MQALYDGMQVLNENRGLVLGVTAILSLNFLFYLKAKQEIFLKTLFPLLLFASLLLRLAYLLDIYLPPYFDSAEHFRIIKEITIGLENATLWDSLPNIVPTYYHLGYHLLLSLLTLGLRADIAKLILVFGQIVLAFIPLPVFLLIWQKTKNFPASLFATLLAGFGWYMPAFAVNWGKYPALLGILAFEILLLNFQQKEKKRNAEKIGLFLGIFIVTLIHTRVLIILFIAFLSWLFAKRIKNFSRHDQKTILRISLFSIIIFFFLIQNDSLLKLTLAPYLNKTSLLLSIIGLFALKKYPRETYFSLFFILFVLVTLFIPTAWILPQFAQQTLLDRPFVEIILFFPLALLGGFGLAGLARITQDFSRPYAPMRDKFITTRNTVFLSFVFLLGFFALKNYNFYPSTCCDFVSYDDTFAFDWIDKNLPQDARILIAGNQLKVIPNTTSPNLVASDAGIWITPLTGRESIMLSHHLELSSTEIINQLCHKEIDYIYLGNTNQSFNHSQLDTNPEWYKKKLHLPNAHIYQLEICP